MYSLSEQLVATLAPAPVVDHVIVVDKGGVGIHVVIVIAINVLKNLQNLINFTLSCKTICYNYRVAHLLGNLGLVDLQRGPSIRSHTLDSGPM